MHDAKIAAEAASLSARASVSLQLPIIRIRPDNLNDGDSREGERSIEDCSIHSVTISNLGATKAFPEDIIYGWTVGAVLPDTPSYRFADRFPHNSILEAEPIILSLSGKQILEAGQRSKILAGNYLWFYCALLYDDFMGERHMHGFCWRWTNTGMGLAWRVDRSAAYNRKT
jgi:hypothetical protein